MPASIVFRSATSAALLLRALPLYGGEQVGETDYCARGSEDTASSFLPQQFGNLATDQSFEVSIVESYERIKS
jgi:hypothetical protein